jgi:hypothetical protein
MDLGFAEWQRWFGRKELGERPLIFRCMSSFSVNPNGGGVNGRVWCHQLYQYPFNGVSVTSSHINARSATQFENFIPIEVTIEEVGNLFAHIVGQIHPERIEEIQPEPTPVSEGSAQSKEEAFRLVPGLLKELFRVVDEFEFLFSVVRLEPR